MRKREEGSETSVTQLTEGRSPAPGDHTGRGAEARRHGRQDAVHPEPTLLRLVPTLCKQGIYRRHDCRFHSPRGNSLLKSAVCRLAEGTGVAFFLASSFDTHCTTCEAVQENDPAAFRSN